MASILKVDELQGIVSAGDITVTSEGGAATQSLQQGLAKAWLLGNSDASLTSASFNIASGTDNGTGDYTYTLTSALSTNLFSASGSINSSADKNLTVNDAATTSYSVESHQQNGSNSDGGNRSMIMGDLA
jgi:hypothetical protein